MRNKNFAVTLLALLVAAVLGGCADGTGEPSGNNSSKEPTYGGSVVVGIQQDIDSLDPHKATAAGTKEILFNIYEGLVKADENGNLINAVAENYTISDDGLTYTFTLRDGIKFSDGNPVTVEDVKYSLERVSGLLDGTPLLSTLKVIKEVKVIDQKTVSVTIESANTELIYSFVTAIIPKNSGDPDSGVKMVGTGPFSYTSYTPQQGIKIEKNPYFRVEGVPYLDSVEFKIVASADTALLELQGGTIDIYPYLTDSQASVLRNKFDIESAPSDIVQALFLNNAVAPLDNVKVRQAICYALDKNSINGFVSGGNGALIGSAMLPTLKDFYKDTNDVYGNDANIEKAKELLKEAGFENGFKMELTVPSNYEFHVQTSEVIAEQLKAVGIEVTINPVEWATWLADVYNGRNYQTTVCGITCDMTPGYLLNRFVSDSKKNFINFNSKEYDEAYLKAQAALDLKEKASYYGSLQDILVREAGTAFIQVPANSVAISRKLGGYKFYPVFVQDMSSVYIAK